LYFLEKKSIILVCLFSVLFVCTIAEIFLTKKYISSFAIPIAQKTIVIDPGHGGIDAGATDNNISEKNINLSISKELKYYLEDNGYKVILTRTEDKTTADPNRPKGMSQKKSDLEERIKTSNKGDIFISIHLNKFEIEKYKGAQVFYADDEKSKILGETIQESLLQLDKTNNRKAKNAKSSIYVLKKSKTPAVLIECGFLSNKTEAELLKTHEYQKEIAKAIYNGIKNHIEKEAE